MNTDDALRELAKSCRAVRKAQRRLDEMVSAARAAGATWAQIGTATQMTRQAAHERWGHLARRGCHQADCDCPDHLPQGCPCGHGPGRGYRPAAEGPG